MAGYSRVWNCERCGDRQESMDYPKVAVCERCVGAHFIVTRGLPSGLLRDLATRAYERGYLHGKAVAERKGA